MTRVLLVLPEPPVPFGGAAARWHHVLLRGLADLGAEVTVLACSASAEVDAQARRLHGETASMRFFAPPERRPLSKLKSLLQPYSYLYSREMASAVQTALTEPFDVIRFETHFTGWLAPHPPPTAELNVHQLYSIDCNHDRASSVRNQVLQTQALRAERKLLRRFRRVSALTPRLADEVRRHHPTAQVRVTPMTIDPEQYEFQERPAGPSPRATIGLIGTFRWGPTLSAAKTLVEEIWPAVRSQMPATRLLLVGRGADQAFGHLAADPGVAIHSDVEDIEPYFRQLDALVYLPTIGSGMKVKVMEAIAYGTPVVTNEEGAEGLPESVAKQISVVDNLSAIPRALRFLTKGPEPSELAELRRSLFAELSPIDCTRAVLCGSRRPMATAEAV